MAKLHQALDSAKIVITAHINSEPGVMTGAELLARAQKMHAVWPTLTEAQQAKWATKAAEIEVVAHLVELMAAMDWDAPQEPNRDVVRYTQLGLKLDGKTCKTQR